MLLATLRLSVCVCAYMYVGMCVWVYVCMYVRVRNVVSMEPRNLHVRTRTTELQHTMPLKKDALISVTVSNRTEIWNIIKVWKKKEWKKREETRLRNKIRTMNSNLLFSFPPSRVHRLGVTYTLCIRYSFDLAA